jgi:hypothetical protein
VKHAACQSKKLIRSASNGILKVVENKEIGCIFSLAADNALQPCHPYSSRRLGAPRQVRFTKDLYMTFDSACLGGEFARRAAAVPRRGGSPAK